MFEPDTVWEFDMANRVAFGDGAAEELPAAMRDRGADTALLVTDPGVAGAGIVDHLLEGLDADVTVFDEVEPDPSRAVFEEAISVAASVDPDVVIGVGGGSSLDVAKTTGIVHEHGGDLMSYVAEPIGEGAPIPGPGVPTIALPTTAGTGSETSPVSVVSLPDRKTKVGISSRHQYPNLAIVDPVLTVSLPPGPTAASGIDALSHAVEAYVTRRFDVKERPENPSDRPDYGGRTMVTDLFARTAIDLIGDNLRRAVNDGRDLEARRNMARASLMAGIAFTNAGLGACHAMAMAFGAEYHTPHGETIAAVLPAVMRYNATGAFDRFREIAELLGEDTTGLSRAESAEAAAEAVEALGADVGLDGGLADFGLGEEDVPAVAEKSNQLQRLLVGNPRRIDGDDLAALFRESL